MPSTTKLFGLVLTARAGRRPSRTRGYGLVITDVDVARARARETRRGTDAMRCLRLSDKGVLSWYTDCCRTPIGNTAASPRFPAPAADRRPAFVSISHLLKSKLDRRLPPAGCGSEPRRLPEPPRVLAHPLDPSPGGVMVVRARVPFDNLDQVGAFEKLPSPTTGTGRATIRRLSARSRTYRFPTS